MKLVNVRSLETSKTKEVEKDRKQESREAAEGEMDVEYTATAVPLVTYVNNVLDAIFSSVEL